MQTAACRAADFTRAPPRVGVPNHRELEPAGPHRTRAPCLTITKRATTRTMPRTTVRPRRHRMATPRSGTECPPRRCVARWPLRMARPAGDIRRATRRTKLRPDEMSGTPMCVPLSRSEARPGRSQGRRCGSSRHCLRTRRVNERRDDRVRCNGPRIRHRSGSPTKQPRTRSNGRVVR